MSVVVQYAIRGTTASAIAASVEEGARAGRLAPGSTLPTVRSLASALGVSPATVAAAYRGLKVRGLLSTQGRHGTRLTHRPPLATPQLPPVPAGQRNLVQGDPDPALLPEWSRALRTLPARSTLYGEETVRPTLRRLARRDMEKDGIPAEHLTLAGGALDGVERVLQAHLAPGDRVAVEDPGYPHVFDLLTALGLVAEPVGIDDFGMRPEELDHALAAGAKACILTPRAQNPTGAAFDARRVRALRSVLDRHPATLVIEDDNAGPAASTEALTVVDRRRERWAVVRSVSKSLGPDLRLAVLAGDALSIARVEGRRALGTGWVSHVLQGIVEALWTDPVTRARLDRAAKVYAERREALLSALAQRGLSAHGRSGLNVWVPVTAEDAVVAHLAAAGWAVRPGERYRLKSPPGIRITVATLRSSEVEALADAMARAIAGRTGRSITA
jgi:DNA-binding transcriptional MocR family regulator